MKLLIKLLFLLIYLFVTGITLSIIVTLYLINVWIESYTGIYREETIIYKEEIDFIIHEIKNYFRD
jgi:hypothetical protein